MSFPQVLLERGECDTKMRKGLSKSVDDRLRKYWPSKVGDAPKQADPDRVVDAVGTVGFSAALAIKLTEREARKRGLIAELQAA